jgi:hypothetical protein
MKLSCHDALQVAVQLINDSPLAVQLIAPAACPIGSSFQATFQRAHHSVRVSLNVSMDIANSEGTQYRPEISTVFSSAYRDLHESSDLHDLLGDVINLGLLIENALRDIEFTA